MEMTGQPGVSRGSSRFGFTCGESVGLCPPPGHCVAASVPNLTDWRIVRSISAHQNMLELTASGRITRTASVVPQGGDTPSVINEPQSHAESVFELN